MGLIAWLMEARDLLLGDSVSMASDRQAELLLPPGNYLRLNSERATKVALDDYESCAGLREVGEQVARLNRERVRDMLLAASWSTMRSPAALSAGQCRLGRPTPGVGVRHRTI